MADRLSSIERPLLEHGVAALRRDQGHKQDQDHCYYTGRVCLEPRAIKTNGRRHRLCQEHRRRANRFPSRMAACIRRRSTLQPHGFDSVPSIDDDVNMSVVSDDTRSHELSHDATIHHFDSDLFDFSDSMEAFPADLFDVPMATATPVRLPDEWLALDQLNGGEGHDAAGVDSYTLSTTTVVQSHTPMEDTLSLDFTAAFIHDWSFHDLIDDPDNNATESADAGTATQSRFGPVDTQEFPAQSAQS